MNLSYLSTRQDDSKRTLEDKKAILMSLIVRLKSESSDLRALISLVQSSITETRRQILQQKEVKEQEEEFATLNTFVSEPNEDYRSLELTQKYLEDRTTEFKLKIMNAKSEFIDSKDKHSNLRSLIAEKDAKIRLLTKKTKEINDQKHLMIVQYSQMPASSNKSFKRRTQSRAQFFARDEIRPYPVSSFQFTLSTEPDISEHLNCSIDEIRSNRSFFAESEILE